MKQSSRNRASMVLAVSLALVCAMLLWQRLNGSTDVLAMARSGQVEQRLLALEHLRSMVGPSADEALRRLARDEDERVAKLAVRELGGRPSEANRRVLEGVLGDPGVSQSLRGEAIAALGGHAEAGDKPLVRMLQEGESPVIRAGAARALGTRRDREAVPVLIEALSDPDPSVRMAAITAINRMTVRRTTYRAEAEPGTQDAAIETIRNLFDPDHSKTIFAPAQ